MVDDLLKDVFQKGLVVVQVPVGVAVEQPGGEVAYGAPVPGSYAPPSQTGGAPSGYQGSAPPPQFARHGPYDSQAHVYRFLFLVDAHTS